MAKSMASVTFLDGCIIKKDHYFTSTRLDAQPSSEYDHGRLQWFSAGKWTYDDRNWQVSSVCVMPDFSPDKQTAHVALEQGTGIVGFYVQGIAKSVDEILPGAEHGHGSASLLKICEIENILYVCGYAGKVMRRVKGTWEHFNHGLKSLTFGDYLKRDMPFDDALRASQLTQRDMRSIGGCAGDNIICVGREGLIFRFDGQIWSQIDAPTNIDLNCVHCTDEGHVYAAGNQSILVQGKKTNFWALNTGVVDDFYSITSFNGDIYVGGLRGLYRFEKSGLRYVDTKQGAFKCKALHSGHGQLLVVAERWLMVFDGNRWMRIDHPDNF